MLNKANRLFVLLLELTLLLSCCGVVNAATPQVSAGDSHTVALHADGTLRTWGFDRSGQLGLGRLINSNMPIKASDITGVMAVAAGHSYTLALKREGSVWAWGKNDVGQLGEGSTTDRNTPTLVPGLSNVIAIAAGSGHSIALKSDGSVWAWGGNGRGQLGDGTNLSRSTPDIVHGLSGVIAIAAGSGHSMALKSNGSVWTWGSNYSGDLGDGTNTDRSNPMPVPGLTGVIAIYAGGNSVALKADGSVWMWGGFNGARPSSMGSSLKTPAVIPGLTGVTAIAVGFLNVVALKADGSLWGMGDDRYSQLGGGNPFDPSTSIPGISGVVAIAAGLGHIAALKNDGSVWAWGFNQSGQVGASSTWAHGVPYKLPNLTGVTAVAAGWAHTVALKSDGSVWSWGNNNFGQLGDASPTNRTVPQVVPDLSGFRAVSAGGNFTLALKDDGSVWSWGYNENGQLGDGTVIDRSTPKPIPGLTGVVSTAAGSGGGIALKADGSVLTWGPHFSGSSLTPVIVPGLTGVTAIAAGYGGTAVLKADGSVWISDYGHPIHAVVPGINGIAAIASHKNSQGVEYIALKGGGSVWTWGLSNNSSQHSTPVVVPNLTGVAAISAGWVNTAIKTDGSVWAWGSVEPTAITGLTGVTGITGGISHSIALKADGSVAAWGVNPFGQLGDGTLAQRPSPVLVVNPSVDGFLNLLTGTTVNVPPELQVPFFVSSTGGITDTSATVSTTIKFNAADIGKQNSVFITAMVPAQYFGASRNALAAPETKAATDPNACVPAYMTPSGSWEQQTGSGVPAYASNITGETASANNILNGPTTNLEGSNICGGYDSSGTNMKMRSIATVPGATYCPNTCPGSATASPTEARMVVEFYNTSLDNYFITADAGEAARIDGGSAGPGWSRTGNTFKSGGSTSVCRFYGSYSPGPNSHFYTADSGECQVLKNQQIPAGDPRKLTVKSWNFESLDFVSTPVSSGACLTGTTPVYRAYNNGFTRGVSSNHRISSSLIAIQEVVARGWSNEGVVMCAPN